MVNVIWAVLAFGAVLSLISAIIRKWKFAYLLSKTTIVGVAGILLLEIILTAISVFGTVPVSEEVTSKATLLGRGISEIMNSGALAFSITLFAAPVWGISKRKKTK